MGRDARPGERLRQVREHRKMSQRRLAKAIGVSVGTVQNYERGRVAITTDRLEQLARALQCEPADLLKPSGSPPPRYRHRYRGFRPRLPRQFVLDFDDSD
jgi:transcriptional regulator with XRE-family HTH domain